MHAAAWPDKENEYFKDWNPTMLDKKENLLSRYVAAIFNGASLKVRDFLPFIGLFS